jgi:hypothetical protein
MFPLSHDLYLNVRFSLVIVKTISVFHKNYEQISTTLILPDDTLRCQGLKTVRKNEEGNRQSGKNPEEGNLLFRSCLNGARGEK